jgi:4-hydroxy-tetrahydrodipicolinate reductase
MIRIAVNGASGRMGSRILALAKEQPKIFNIAQTFDLDGNFEKLAPYTLAGGEAKLKCDVLIDFSGPDGAQDSADAARVSKKALVIGSTGLDEKFMEKIKSIASRIPVVLSSNMSVGVNVMLALVSEAAKKLSDGFDLQISETHHSHKKDAPSGTALMLLSEIARARQWTAQRVKKEKGLIHSIREGEIVGDHTVLFSGPAESIEITHRARSRDTFARGALLAAQFVSKKTKGLYSMRDVLQ